MLQVITHAQQEVKPRTRMQTSALRTERALYGVAERSGVMPHHLRSALLQALTVPICAAFEQPYEGAIRVGRAGDGHQLIRANGLRLLLAAGANFLDPTSAVLVHRHTKAGVVVRSGVRFGDPGVLRGVAMTNGLEPSLLLQAVIAVQGSISVAPEAPVDWLSPTLLWSAGAG